jgi:hypothetical protein
VNDSLCIIWGQAMSLFPMGLGKRRGQIRAFTLWLFSSLVEKSETLKL